MSKLKFEDLHAPILYCPNPECAHPWNVKLKKNESETQVVCMNCHTSGPKFIDSIKDTIDVWNQFKRISREECETEEVELSLSQEEFNWLNTEAHNLKITFNTYVNAVLVSATEQFKDKECIK